MSDDPLTDCPSCGKAQLKRLVSAAGFRLKGGGWYETDFKQGNQRNLAGDSDGGKAKAGSKSDGGGESGKSAKTSSSDSSSKSDTKKPSGTTGKAASA